MHKFNSAILLSTTVFAMLQLQAADEIKINQKTYDALCDQFKTEFLQLLTARNSGYYHVTLEGPFQYTMLTSIQDGADAMPRCSSTDVAEPCALVEVVAVNQQPVSVFCQQCERMSLEGAQKHLGSKLKLVFKSNGERLFRRQY